MKEAPATWIATALLQALCAVTPAARPPPDPAEVERCGLDEWAHHYLNVDPAAARQGSTLRLQPMQQRGPAMPAVPIECTADWSVSDPALASLSEDRRTLHIADDATPGAHVTVSYRVGGRRVGNSVSIVGRDAVVLTGRRMQRKVEGCDGLEPVRELEFSAEGRFAVTFFPFETYKDYWGTYRFDPATGALSMTVEDGNNRPDALDLEGTARLSADGLVLEGLYLGHPRGGGPTQNGVAVSNGCRYTFG
jgi:hypothetical protein